MKIWHYFILLGTITLAPTLNDGLRILLGAFYMLMAIIMFFMDEKERL